jgi:hypothetical protein
VLRLWRDDHRTIEPHHENLCSACLIFAAVLGEPLPEGRYIEPAQRANVYARTLALLGCFSTEQLGAVVDANAEAQLVPDTEHERWLAAQYAVVALLGVGNHVCGAAFDGAAFDGAAYHAICDAVQVPQGSPTRSGRATAGGDVSQDLRDIALGGEASTHAQAAAAQAGNEAARKLRDDLLGQLLFAARHMAMQHLVSNGGRVLCLECLEFGATTEAIPHRLTCGTRRVLNLVARICAIAPTFAVEDKGPARERVSRLEELAELAYICRRLVDLALVAATRPLDECSAEEVSAALAVRLAASRIGQGGAA